MKKLILLLFGLLAALSAPAQEPLYIVNGEVRDEIRSIPPADIEHVEMLPADEQTVADHGQKANNGVMIITLRYDTPARFDAEGMDFDRYIGSRVKWTATDPAARVVFRFTVTAEGKAVAGDELESTDNRLRRRVLKALEEAPLWTPATRQGLPVASEGILCIQLPEGVPMPRERTLVLR